MVAPLDRNAGFRGKRMAKLASDISKKKQASKGFEGVGKAVAKGNLAARQAISKAFKKKEG